MSLVHLTLPDVSALNWHDPKQRRQFARALQSMTQQLNHVLQNLNQDNFDHDTHAAWLHLQTQQEALAQQQGQKQAWSGEKLVERICASEAQLDAAHLRLEGLCTQNGGFAITPTGEAVLRGGEIALQSDCAAGEVLRVAQQGCERHTALSPQGMRQCEAGQESFSLQSVAGQGRLAVWDAAHNAQAVFGGAALVHPALAQGAEMPISANVYIDPQGVFHRCSGSAVVYEGRVTGGEAVVFEKVLRGSYLLSFHPDAAYTGGDVCCYLNDLPAMSRACYTYSGGSGVYGSVTRPIVCYQNSTTTPALYTGCLQCLDTHAVLSGQDMRGSAGMEMGQSIIALQTSGVQALRFSATGWMKLVQMGT